MQIAMVATEFAPFSNPTGLGAEIAALASELKKRGNTVNVIIPMIKGIDPSSHSLAKRLRPAEVTVDGKTHKWERYDGRTSFGVEAHLLASAEGAGIENGFAQAAAAVLAAVAEDGCRCLSWNRECAPIGLLSPASGPSIWHGVVYSNEDTGADPVGGARHVIIWGKGTADSMGALGHPASGMVSDGKATVISRASSKTFVLSGRNKASFKASFQTEFGLPVRTDVPLFFFTSPDQAVLTSFLQGDVQAAVRVHESDDSLDPLQERYPDRLAVATKGAIMDTWLPAADFCTVGTTPVDAMTCLAAGVVPVTTVPRLEGTVDLETSLESGCAIVAAGPSTSEVGEALSRCLGAFARVDAFSRLCRRLPGYAETVETQARKIMDLFQADIES